MRKQGSFNQNLLIRLSEYIAFIRAFAAGAAAARLLTRSLKGTDTPRLPFFLPRRGSLPSDTIMLRKNLSIRKMKGISVSKFDWIFYVLPKKLTQKFDSQ